MFLRNLVFSPFYNSKQNDLINEFYIPALSNCKEYKRVSAFFDSNILRLYSTGLESIVSSNGHISFIFSSQISENDFELMKEGYSNREKVELGLLNKLTFEESPEISNLAYLISKGYIDIKIAFTKKGILHDKFGLIIQNDDVLYFRGSNNETVAAIENNYESFETSSSWNADKNEIAKINNALREFELLWSNKSDSTIVIDIPEIIKDEILKFNQGKMILCYEKKENAFVFDLDEENHLIGFNNLNSKFILLPPTLWYRGYFSYYVKNSPSLENPYYEFVDSLNYVSMRKLIAILQQKANDNNFEIYISPKLRRFLADNDLQLEKRRSLGIGIKQKADILLPAFNEFKKIVDDSLERKLRTPQMWDAFHIAKMKRAANFSVPGSGKTSVVYGAFAYLKKMGLVDKIVMVGPINSFLSWKNEFSLNFGNKLHPNIYDYHEKNYSSEQSRFDGLRNDTKNSNLVLINYESVPMNIDALKTIINSKTLLVFDEIHRIKSIEGKRAIACLDISSRATYRVALTGTPIPNGFIDIYNFLHILYAEEYNIVFDFDKSFLGSANFCSEKKDTINNAIYPFFCRTTKKDLNVPPPEEDDITTGYCVYDERFAALLELIYRECAHNVLLLYVRLMQASTNPSLILRKLNYDDLQFLNKTDYEDSLDAESVIKFEERKEQYSFEEREFIKSFGLTEKFYKGIDLAEKIVSEGNQVIIWEVFVDSISETREALKKRGISCETISGAVPLQERESIIKKFINKDFKVLVTNPHTLAESVSLHKNCHHAIYMEYSFNLVHMLQSRDRIHRLGLGQNEKTYYYYMMMDNPIYDLNTIDLKIYERLKIKEEIQKNAVEGDDLVYIEEDYKKDIEELLNL